MDIFTFTQIYIWQPMMWSMEINGNFETTKTSLLTVLKKLSEETFEVNDRTEI